MFIVIGIMFGGIFIGYLMRRVSLLRFTNKAISLAIILLLFLLGIQVGNNKEIMTNLPLLGGQALLISSAGTLGSLLCGWAVYYLFYKEKTKKG